MAELGESDKVMDKGDLPEFDLSVSELLDSSSVPSVLVESNTRIIKLKNEAAKSSESKEALSLLREAVDDAADKMLPLSRIEMKSDESRAWVGHSFGKYTIYRLEDDEVAKLRAELEVHKSMLDTYQKKYKDVKMLMSTLGMELRTPLNGALGLSEMLVDTVQSKTPSLSDSETREIHDIASAIRSMSTNAATAIMEVQTRIYEMDNPPRPPPRPRTPEYPPRPEKDELLYEHVPNIRVLVIEDNIINQKVISKLLEKGRVLKDNIVVADDAEKGLQMLDPSIDLVFVDQTLPDIPGIELIERIMGPEIRMNMAPWFTVIGMAVSAWGDGDVEHKMKEAGANDVLMKPLRTIGIWAQCLRVAEMKRHANLPPVPWKL